MGRLSKTAICFSVGQILTALSFSLTHYVDGRLAAAAVFCHCAMIYAHWQLAKKPAATSE